MSSYPNKTLILTSPDVQSIITYHGVDTIMDNLIHSMEKEMIEYHPDNIQIPARSGFNYQKPKVGLVEWMPLYQVGNKVTIKIVGYHPRNPDDYNLPTILSSISQYDSNTGHLLGLLDGVLLTALRTGAASAIATSHLARKDSTTLGLIGCGAQAITQLHAISRKFNIKEVIFYDKDKTTSDSFQHRASCVGLHSTFHAKSIEEIVAHSDILCTATSIEVDKGPLFEKLIPKPHVHINAVGSDFPGKVELPMDIIDRSFLCPDFIDQALIEGECQRVNAERIDANLSDITRTPADYKKYQDKISVFDSTGWALEDHVIMNDFLHYASELGIGKEIELEFIPEDSKNPYHFISEMSLTPNQ